MKIGKISSDALQRTVFSNISKLRPEVLVRPGIGEDCAVIDFDKYAAVLSTDPITGTTKDIGRLAVHICCNDIAANGVEPLGIMLTILAPAGTTEEDIAKIMADANGAATSINVEIIGGHTEITAAVNQIVISGTAIGRQLKEQVVLTQGAKPGNWVIMTKHAGLEGAAIISAELEDKLKDVLTPAQLDNAQSFNADLSVIKEGLIGGRIGASSMHDVTEGGILGALWEVADASGTGIEVYLDKIPVREETRLICEYLSINPYRLISSGTMLITIAEDKLDTLMSSLEEQGVQATVIGRVVEKDRTLLKGNEQSKLDPPDTDELFKVL